MKSLKKWVFIAFVFNVLSLSSYAAIVGSDMGWTCLGGDSFLIKVSVYNDCNSTAMGNIAVNFKCFSTGSTITTLNLLVPIPVDITPICRTSCTRCQSSTCSFPYGIQQYSYQKIVHLSAAGSCCEIRMSLSYGIRSSSIITIVPGTSFYNEARFNRCLNPCDNSPVFTNPPIAILCVGQDFTYNNGVKDNDYNTFGGLADLITYEFAPSLKDADSSVSYLGSYAYNKPIFFWGFPNDALPFPRGIHLDPQYGDIQFRPMKAEVTVMAIKANEYRNGVKIAEVRRDVQIIVIPCINNNPPSITTPNNIRSKTVCVGDTLTFNFSTNDPNAPDTVAITWNNTIPGAIWTNSNGLAKHPTATLKWAPTAQQAGSVPHTFTVTAKDNACPVSASFTQAYQIIVIPLPDANIVVSDSGCGNFYFKASPISGASPTYLWKGDSFTFSPNTGSSVYHNFNAGNYPYKLEMRAQTCLKTYYDTVTVDTFMSVYLPADTAVCVNSTIQLKAFVANANKSYSLKWGSGKVSFTNDSTLTKQITITKDTTIWIRATYNSFNCPYDEIKIKANPLPKPYAGADDTICKGVKMPLIGSPFTGLGTWRGIGVEGSFPNWKFNPDTSAITSGGKYDVIYHYTDIKGCQNEDTVKLTVFSPLIVDAGVPKEFCVDATAINLTGNPAGGTWTGKGVTANQFFPAQASFGVHDLIYSYTNVICKASDTVKYRVWALPLVSANTLNGKTIFCRTDALVQLNGQPSSGTWSGPGIVGAAFNPALGADSITNYLLTYEFTDIHNCKNFDDLKLRVKPEPQVLIDPSASKTCSGMPQVLYASSLNSIGVYWWKGMYSDGNIIGSPNSKMVIYNPGTNDLIKLYFWMNVMTTHLDSVCAPAWDSVKVNIGASPITDFVANPTAGSPSLSVQFNDLSLIAKGKISAWEWSFGDGKKSGYPNPFHIYSNTGKYTVMLTTISDEGCMDTMTKINYINTTTGIEDQNSTEKLKFYPNPAHNLLFVENMGNNAAFFMLTNILGKPVFETRIISGKNFINIQNFSPGIYLIYQDGIIAGKLIIE